MNVKWAFCLCIGISQRSNFYKEICCVERGKFESQFDVSKAIVINSARFAILQITLFLIEVLFAFSHAAGRNFQVTNVVTDSQNTIVLLTL